MDPDEVLGLVIGGLDDDDDYSAVTGLSMYSSWVSRGGFPADPALLDSLDTATAAWADRWDDRGWDEPAGGGR